MKGIFIKFNKFFMLLIITLSLAVGRPALAITATDDYQHRDRQQKGEERREDRNRDNSDRRNDERQQPRHEDQSGSRDNGKKPILIIRKDKNRRD